MPREPRGEIAPNSRGQWNRAALSNARQHTSLRARPVARRSGGDRCTPPPRRACCVISTIEIKVVGREIVRDPWLKKESSNGVRLLKRYSAAGASPPCDP